MTKKEMFNTIKSTIENIAKTIEINDKNFVIIVGLRGDYKYQSDYTERVFHCSESQAKEIIATVEKECKDIFNNDRKFYVTYMYVPTAYTKSSLVSNAVYMPR